MHERKGKEETEGKKGIEFRKKNAVEICQREEEKTKGLADGNVAEMGNIRYGMRGKR